MSTSRADKLPQTIADGDDEGERFAFGDNWVRFLETVGDASIAVATRALARMLQVESLSGRTFLDVGSGSGLSSLAAMRLGADRVHSFDVDTQSVAAALALRRRFHPGDERWTIEAGSILDRDYLEALGLWDVVYSWGVLHHTGQMWQSIDAAAALVAPGGSLFISIYNDQGRRSDLWRVVKRTYNRLPQRLRPLYVSVVSIPLRLRSMRRGVLASGPLGYIRSRRRPGRRGMSKKHDMVDWIGGYPFEVAKPEDVFAHCQTLGFELAALRTCGGDMGCNEFVFRRLQPAGAPELKSNDRP